MRLCEGVTPPSYPRPWLYLWLFPFQNYLKTPKWYFYPEDQLFTLLKPWHGWFYYQILLSNVYQNLFVFSASLYLQYCQLKRRGNNSSPYLDNSSLNSSTFDILSSLGLWDGIPSWFSFWSPGSFFLGSSWDYLSSTHPLNMYFSTLHPLIITIH